MTPKYETWLKGVLEKAHNFPHQGTDILGLVLQSNKLTRSGTWVEFGVASGVTLRKLASSKGQAKVWGFDTFTGLPEDWRLTGAVHLKGHFAQDQIPKVDGAHLVTGLFQDTLPSWNPPDPITLVHIDCDIYSGAKCALDHVMPRLAPGAIISFDELLEYPGFEEHEMKALYEATEAGLQWEFIYVSGEKAAIICGQPPESLDFMAYTPDPSFVPPEVLPQIKPASTPVKKSGKKMAFLLDPWACPKPISPETAFTDARGLTGSEITNLMQAIGMAKLGHDVTLYSNFTQNLEIYGIKCAQWNRWPSESKQDWYAAFATIHPACLQHLGSGTLRVFNKQVNDFGYCGGWEQYTDIVTALSNTHKQHLSQSSNFGNWKILPNGCNPADFQEGDRNNRKLVFASSPDRGLHWLLELFPRLRKRIPDAECHVYYAIQDTAIQVFTNIGEHEMANRYKYVNLAVAKLKDHGVFHHKSVSRQEIAKVFSNSRILAYTCDPVRFTEGFSCTTLEAAVAGCLPVIVGADALGEIYGNFVPTIPSPYSKNRDQYFDTLMKYLIDNDAYKQAQTKAKEMAKTHNWTEINKQLEVILGLSG